MEKDEAVWIRERLSRIEKRVEDVERCLRDHPEGQLADAMARRCGVELVERRVVCDRGEYRRARRALERSLMNV